QPAPALLASAREAPAEREPFAERELAVRGRELDPACDLGHALEQRQRPGRRNDIDDRTRVALGEELVQRLREHHVADPRRTDDEQLAIAHESLPSAPR